MLEIFPEPFHWIVLENTHAYTSVLLTFEILCDFSLLMKAGMTFGLNNKISLPVCEGSQHEN